MDNVLYIKYKKVYKTKWSGHIYFIHQDRLYMKTNKSCVIFFNIESLLSFSRLVEFSSLLI